MKLNSLLTTTPVSPQPRPGLRRGSWLGGLLAGLLTLAAGPARAQSSAYFRPDSALTRRAYLLTRHFERPAWNSLAASLWAKPHPVWSYLYYGQPRPAAHSLPYPSYAQYYAPGYVSWARPAYRAFKRLNSHVEGLRLERRVADYQQLASLLLARATKVRKIKQALPLLVLLVDSAGRVQDVAVNKQRTHYGLTTRSRKIILKTLRENDFRVREAYDYFDQPRPFHEKLVATRHRVGSAAAATSHFLFDWALYHKVRRLGRCGEVRYVKVPWFGRE